MLAPGGGLLARRSSLDGAAGSLTATSSAPLASALAAAWGLGGFGNGMGNIGNINRSAPPFNEPPSSSDSLVVRVFTPAELLAHWPQERERGCGGGCRWGCERECEWAHGRGGGRSGRQWPPGTLGVRAHLRQGSAAVGAPPPRAGRQVRLRNLNRVSRACGLNTQDEETASRC